MLLSDPRSPDKGELDRLAQEVARERQADAEWFASNPQRSIRVRPAFPSEARRSSLLSTSPLPADARRYMLVRRLTPRGLVRLPFLPPPGFKVPETEGGARRVWEALCAAGATIEGMPADQFVKAAAVVLEEAA
jgi:hypothetical protein